MLYGELYFRSLESLLHIKAILKVQEEKNITLGYLLSIECY